MERLYIQCEGDDCGTALESIRTLMLLLGIRFQETGDGLTMHVLSPLVDEVEMYIMALVGRGLWAESRARVEPC